ncbi:MAG: flagellar biosynthetic protein FliO [Cyanobacteria bacterium]|nr:flagellar biosynthetic protein FliO [Cyanobacteriota bacterium]
MFWLLEAYITPKSLIKGLLPMRRSFRALLGSMLLITAFQSSLTPGLAGSRGLSIRQDAKKPSINVTIDPGLIPDAQIHRSDTQMTIELPDNAFSTGNKPGFDIPGSLTSSGAVKVERRGKSTAITINANQIYMNIEELDDPTPGGTQGPTASSLKKVDSVLLNQAARKQTLTKKPDPSKPELGLLNNTKPVGTNPKQTVGINQKPQPIQSIQPLSQKPLVSQPTNSLASTAVTPLNKPVSVPAGSATQINTDITAATTPLQTTQTQLPQGEKPIATLDPPATQTEAPVQELKEGDTGIPLASLTRHQDVASDQGINLGQIIVSVLGVIAMIVAGLKYGLPFMQERYPLWYQAFQNKYKVSPEVGDAPTSFQTEVRAKPAKASKPMPQGDVNKQQYLMRAYQNQGEHTDNHQFDVLSSAQLAKGKDLYLVQIKNRQLVIATTPYSVNLLTEFADDPSPSVRGENNIQLPGETTAYIEKSKPDSTSADNALYQKYLPGQQHAETTNRAKETFNRISHDANTHNETHNDSHSLASDTIEPESVVVLKDYDDEY